MRILVTGAKGFLGKNLCARLEALRDEKDPARSIRIEAVLAYDRDCEEAVLDAWCREADFVFHLAGVNRAADPAQIWEGNVSFSRRLLETLIKYNNRCPLMLASSVYASLQGRYARSAYGQSKQKAEELFFRHGKNTGAQVYVYRFPNVFGKWCRPNYNSAVATFCHGYARDLPVTVSDPDVELELVYIDDLVEEMLDALEGKPCRCGKDGAFCAVPMTHRATLGEIAGLLEGFRHPGNALWIPQYPRGSFAEKLYATYLSYLPEDKAVTALSKKEDSRGSFTELLRMERGGQFSVNVTKPGERKGQHWHHSKWEIFWVVRGSGRIRMRRVGDSEVLTYDVTGECPQAVRILPGYVHSITNLSHREELVTLMWASECFDPERPDTYQEAVEE